MTERLCPNEEEIRSASLHSRAGAQDAAALGELDARAFAEAKPGKVTLVLDRAELQPDFAAADIARVGEDLRHALDVLFGRLSSRMVMYRLFHNPFSQLNVVSRVTTPSWSADAIKNGLNVDPGSSASCARRLRYSLGRY